MKFVKEFEPQEKQLKFHVEVTEGGTVRVFATEPNGTCTCVYRLRQTCAGTLSVSVDTVDGTPMKLRRNVCTPVETFTLSDNLRHCNFEEVLGDE